jgi:hypothetical protein
MQKRYLVSCVSAGFLLSFAVFGSGCKKEETKVEPAAPAPTTQSATRSRPSMASQTTVGMFNMQITIDNAPQNMKPGATTTVPVKVKNTSSEKWVRDSANPINLSYHWRNEADKKSTVWDGMRTIITKDVAPGEEIALLPRVKAPKAGNYVLEFDMVLDGPNGGWFSKKGSAVASIPVEVK